MTVAELIISQKPKALLNPSLPISVGDIVTTNDDFEIIEDGNVYIVKDITCFIFGFFPKNRIKPVVKLN